MVQDLKISIKDTLEASEEEHCPESKEDFYEKIPVKFQVKHAVSLFIKVNNLVTKAGDAWVSDIEMLPVKLCIKR